MLNVSVYILPVQLSYDSMCSSSSTPCYAFLGVFSPLLLMFMLSGTCMFPVYLQYLKQNYERDRVLPDYPLVLHYEKVIHWTESLFVGAFLELILLYYSDYYYILRFFAHAIIELTYMLWLTVVMSEQVAICALVAHRDLNTLNDNNSYFITTSLISMIRKFAYLPIMIVNVLVGCFKFSQLKYHHDNFDGSSTLLFWIEILQMGAYLIISTLMIPCALMVVNMKSKPEKYLKDLILMFILVKILYIPSLLFISISFASFGLATVFGGFAFIDGILFHFILQFIYLNRVNGYFKKEIFRENTSRVNVQVVMSNDPGWRGN